jgi:hypothetical protein
MNSLVLMKTMRQGCLAGANGLELSDGPAINGEPAAELSKDSEIMG